MDYRPYLIANYKTGVETDVQPWLLPADAFQSMTNVHIHKGRILKRGGYQFLAHFVHHQTTISAITAADPAQVTVASAVGLSNDQKIQISYATGGSYDDLNGGRFTIKNLVGTTFDLYDADGTTAIDTSTYGVYGGSGVLCIFPENPVMGIRFFNNSTSFTQIACDTRRACTFNTTTSSYDPLDTADIFTGDNTNFISSAYYGKTDSFATATFFFTNFNGDSTGAIDNMRTYTTGTTTAAFVPNANPGGTAVNINAAQFIFPFRQRLCLLNTVEDSGAGNVSFPQRLRWCRAGNPAASGNNWDQVTPGNGGFVDAPTSERIVGAKFIQEVILVFFTNSCWMIRPTSDPALPFRWDKINDFRACDSPYSTIGYDRFVISFGKRGIVACDTTQAQRIDEKIEDFYINEINSNAATKVFSERNFSLKHSLTLYPPANDPTSAGNEETTSSRILVRTDDDNSWSIYTAQVPDDSGDPINFSSLGFGRVFEGFEFSDFNGIILQDLAFEDFGDERFQDYYFQDNSELLLGGDQMGRVFIMEKGGDDNGNAIDVEMVSGAWNPYKETGSEAQLGYVDFYVDADEETQVTVEFFLNDMTAPYATETFNCLPPLGFIADIQNVQLTNPATIYAPSHGLSTGAIVYIYGIQGTDEIQGGPYTVTVVDENTITLDGIDATAYTTYISGGQIVELPFQATKCWKRVYAGGIGYTHYVRISHTGKDNFLNIDSITPWFAQIGTRMIG